MNFNRTRQAFLTLIALAALNVTALGQEYNNVRALTEINTPDQAESYPYLSADGLRLYFLQGTGGKGTLKVATRTDVKEVFGNVQVVQGLPTDISSYSLANNEMDIVFTRLNILKNCSWRRRASASTAHDFSANNIYTGAPLTTPSFQLNGRTMNGSAVQYIAPTIKLTSSSCYLYSTAITADGHRYIARHTYNTSGGSFGTYVALTSATSSDCATNNNSPCSAYEIGSGQVSKEGTKFYLSLKDNNSRKSLIYSVPIHASSGNILNSNIITTYTPFEGEITENNAIQPSISEQISPPSGGGGNKRYIAFVQNFGGYWEGDDLYIADYLCPFGACRQGIADEPAEFTSKLALHAPIPNPSSGEVLFRYSLPAETQEATLAIYSVEGIKLKEVELNTELEEFYQKNHDLSDGYYYCVLTTPQGRSVQRLVIIK